MSCIPALQSLYIFHLSPSPCSSPSRPLLRRYIEDPSDANFCTMCSDLTTGCPATLPAVLEKKCSPKSVDNVDNGDVGLNSQASPVIKAGQQTRE